MNRSKTALAGAPQLLATRTPISDPDARIARVLRIVSGLLGVLFLLAWGATLTVSGNLAREFESLAQWLPPVVTLLASLAVVSVTRSNRVGPRGLQRIGLAYMVIVSYGIAGTQYAGAFAGFPAELINQDRVGISMVAVWMIFYTIVVPAPPRQVLPALIASAAAVPIIYAASVVEGLAPPLTAETFMSAFIIPYVIAGAGGYAGARFLHRLNEAARRATELGSYRLEEPIGRGGMGEVWRASHLMLARPAAIKLIRREVLGGDEDAVRAIVSRFEREAQVTASLQSPHTIVLYDYGVSQDGSLFYVMELLEGIDLQTLVSRHGPLPPERVVHILSQACESLQEAHLRGLIHRDIKPANIQLCRRALEYDFVKVLDFGLVKRVGRVLEEEAADVTRIGVLAGTPAFMAPEVIAGEPPADGRADLYGLGCVAYWLLTGTHLFGDRTPAAVLAAHIHERPEPPSRGTDQPVPEPLDAIVLRCLAKRPEDRPPSARDLASELAAIALDAPWTAARAQEWWALHLPAAGGDRGTPRVT